MYCGNCGAEIDDNSSFCGNCGAKISNAPAPQREYKNESNYSLGNEAVKNGDYAKAMEYFKLSADEGNADAMYEISDMYSKGEGVESDKRESFAWMLRAAEAGNSEAMVMVSLKYKSGRGTDKNMDEAVKWMKKAVENGQVGADKLLEVLEDERMEREKDIEERASVKANEEETKKLVKKAVENGENGANGLLKQLENPAYYKWGINEYIKKDYAKAMEYFKLSANEGNADAMFQISKMYDEGKGVEADKRESFKWKLKSKAYNVKNVLGLYDNEGFDFTLVIREAEAGNICAMHLASRAYLDGKGTDANIDEAIKWAQKVVENYADTNNSATRWLMLLTTPSYLERVGNNYYHQKNYASAKECYRLSADKGNADAAKKLRVLEDEEDEEKANQLKQLAENGDVEAMCKISLLYRDGKGVRQDANACFKWCVKAAEAGNGWAMTTLASYYRTGYGTGVDNIDAAIRWAQKALDEGADGAYKLLQDLRNEKRSRRIGWIMSFASIIMFLLAAMSFSSMGRNDMKINMVLSEFVFSLLGVIWGAKGNERCGSGLATVGAFLNALALLQSIAIIVFVFIL